jgi:hypothetical protein
MVTVVQLTRGNNLDDLKKCYILFVHNMNLRVFMTYIHTNIRVLAALLVGRSPDRSPVVSLGIFSEATDKSMCPGSTQPFEMSTRIFLG